MSARLRCRLFAFSSLIIRPLPSAKSLKAVSQRFQRSPTGFNLRRSRHHHHHHHHHQSLFVHEIVSFYKVFIGIVFKTRLNTLRNYLTIMLKCFECSDVISLIVIHYDGKLTCKYVSSGTGFPRRQCRIRRWPKYTLMEPARGHAFFKCPIMHWDIKIT